MWICDDCGAIFDDDDCVTITEWHPYGEGVAGEDWAACPHCQSTNMSKAKKCSRCGEWVAETREDLCDVCYEDMYDE